MRLRLCLLMVGLLVSRRLRRVLLIVVNLVLSNLMRCLTRIVRLCCRVEVEGSRIVDIVVGKTFR